MTGDLPIVEMSRHASQNNAGQSNGFVNGGDASHRTQSAIIHLGQDHVIFTEMDSVLSSIVPEVAHWAQCVILDSTNRSTFFRALEMIPGPDVSIA